VLSYSTAQRTREIGVRMAWCGARKRAAIGVAEGCTAGLGLAIGIAAALLLTRLMTTCFMGPATDPLTFVGVSAVLAASSILACYVPARKATKIDPMVALSTNSSPLKYIVFARCQRDSPKNSSPGDSSTPAQARRLRRRRPPFPGIAWETHDML